MIAAAMKLKPSPRNVSAKRRWPPGCGRVSSPAPLLTNGGPDGDKEAAVMVKITHSYSPATSNGQVLALPPPLPDKEEDSGGASKVEQTKPEALTPNGVVMKPSYFDAATDVVDVAVVEDEMVVVGNGSLQNGDLEGSMLVVSKKKEVELEVLNGVKKRWLVPAIYPPPKRRAISAKRKFPPGCGRKFPSAAATAPPPSAPPEMRSDVSLQVDVQVRDAELEKKLEEKKEVVEAEMGNKCDDTLQPVVPEAELEDSLAIGQPGSKQKLKEEVTSASVGVPSIGSECDLTLLPAVEAAVGDAYKEEDINGKGLESEEKNDVHETTVVEVAVGVAEDEDEDDKSKAPSMEEELSMVKNQKGVEEVQLVQPIEAVPLNRVVKKAAMVGKKAVRKNFTMKSVKDALLKSSEDEMDCEMKLAVGPELVTGVPTQGVIERVSFDVVKQLVVAEASESVFAEKRKGKILENDGNASANELQASDDEALIFEDDKFSPRTSCVASHSRWSGQKEFPRNYITKKDAEQKMDGDGSAIADGALEDDTLDAYSGRLVVQALMSADRCPWMQGRKSITSPHTLPPKGKSKKDGLPKKPLLTKEATGSKLNCKAKLKEEGCSKLEDPENVKTLVVYEGKRQRKCELSVNLPPCVPQSRSNETGDHHTDARSKVRRLLKLFQLICRKLLQGEESKKCKIGRLDLEAAKVIKRCPEYEKHKSIIGHVPGVEVGDEFHYRVELSIVGLHGPFQGGIDSTVVNGKRLATSIVASGGYPDELMSTDELTYTGSGGKPDSSKKKGPEDQKLERGNLALNNCIDAQSPVRVIHGFKGPNRGEFCDPRAKQVSTFTYDGLYRVVKCYPDKGANGFKVFKFTLKRIPGQPELALHIVRKTKGSEVREGLVVQDISGGNERIPICAINTIDGEQPAPFNYITNIIYPPWYKKSPPLGCDCKNGCSDSDKCACAVKNGGEIPFNFNGAIVQAKSLIYECGPSCRCPPTCHNRVSQHGIRTKLEIFKTATRGWGVRSLSSIPSGSFICEYVGELLQDTEAEQRDNDEYLFDIGHNYDDQELWKDLPQSLIPDLKSSSCVETVADNGEEMGFTIDAVQWGNVGRFINHSCSPNIYAQNVLFDHDDIKMPHVMFFAAENIPPMQELSYHYNYNIDQVRDADGNIKRKDCYCGSAECTGRLY